jgi:hypothetical protein
MSNSDAKAVDTLRNELVQLRMMVQHVQGNYKRTAEKRVHLQKKMARMVQTVQERAMDDAPLVEDVIVVSLQAETAAANSRSHIPNAPMIDALSQPSGRTSSAEEAIAVYTSQIETLSEDRTYRDALLEAETAMVEIYTQGVYDILSTVKQYSKDSKLIQEIEQMA